MKTIPILIGILFITLTTSALAQGQRQNVVRESVEVAQHHLFASETEVNGATILIRDFQNQVVDINVTTKALVPDTAYSIWIAVFNKPRQCATPYQCGLGDLSSAQVEASVFWGGGVISDAFGYGTTQMKLVPGRTERELFTGGDYGLANMKAEIHVVLRSHGTIGVAGNLATQIGTARQACPPENCSNDFASIHSYH